MQRSFTYKKILTGFALVMTFVLYQSFSSIYLLFPPMLGVLFFYFMHALEKEDLPKLLLVILLLLVFEAEKDFLLFSSLVYFTFIYRFVIPHLRIMISCHICLKVLLLFISYLGYIAFSYILSQVLWVEAPSVDWHVFYYMFIEFFLVLGI